MNFIRDIFSIPFGYIIGFFYEITDNYILSLLFMTLCVKLLLIPFSIKQQKGMAKSQRMQPKIRRIREKYAGNQMKMQEEMNALYQREGFSSMTGGCTSMLITLPVMMGVYSVNYRLLSFVLKIPNNVIAILTEALKALNLDKNEMADFRLELTVISHWNEIDKTGISEEFIAKIDDFVNNFTFLGINLYDKPEFRVPSILWIIPVLVGVISLGMSLYTYLRQRKTNPEMAKNPSMGCMTLMSPLMSIYFAFLFPVSVGVYNILSISLSFIQMVVLNLTHAPKKVLARTMVEETVNRRARERIIKTAAEKKNSEE